MELTKQDKKHIKERVDKLRWRIVDEAAEYARLYEKTFYEEVVNYPRAKDSWASGFAEKRPFKRLALTSSPPV